MSFGVLGELNWLAVVVATIAYFALGGVWFMPFALGKPWMRAMGWEPSAEERPSPLMYVGPLVTTFVSSIAIAMLAAASQTDTFVEGLVLGVVTGLGIAGAIMFITGYFEPKKPQPMIWAAITGGYHLAGLLIVSVILAVWQ
ncbi:MAG: DUF1761 domain-containing protein [Dehalococcoidia bacterium]